MRLILFSWAQSNAHFAAGLICILFSIHTGASSLVRCDFLPHDIQIGVLPSHSVADSSVAVDILRMSSSIVSFN